jgi:hypothetical protein
VASAAAGAGRGARANRHAIPYPLPIHCNQGKSRANQGKLSQIKAKNSFFLSMTRNGRFAGLAHRLLESGVAPRNRQFPKMPVDFARFFGSVTAPLKVFFDENVFA